MLGWEHTRAHEHRHSSSILPADKHPHPPAHRAQGGPRRSVTTQNPLPSPSCQLRAASCASDAQIIFPRLTASHFPAAAPSLLGSELAELSSLALSTRNSSGSANPETSVPAPCPAQRCPQGPAATPRPQQPPPAPAQLPSPQKNCSSSSTTAWEGCWVLSFETASGKEACQSLKGRRKSNFHLFRSTGFPAHRQAQRSPGHWMRGYFPSRSKDSSFARASSCS